MQTEHNLPRFPKSHNQIILTLDTIEKILLTLAARIGPWLIPVLPAYTVGTVLYKHLHTWPAVAIIGATAFELAGIAATKTALHAWVWNNARRKTDPAAPFGLAVFLSILYFFVGIGLSVALEIWPELVKIAPASFFLLAGQSYFVLAISHNLTQWDADRRLEVQQRAAKTGLQTELDKLAGQLEMLAADITASQTQLADLDSQIADRQQKLERLNRQKEGQNGQIDPSNGTILNRANEARQAEINRRRQKVLTLRGQELTHQAIANQLGVSLGTVKNDLKALNGQVTK